MMIRVDNVKTYEQSADEIAIYVGRSGKNPSPLGNPYSHLKYSRAQFRVNNLEESLEKYLEWLRYNYQNNQRVRSEIDRIVNLLIDGKNIVLLCHCDTNQCHAYIIKSAVEKLFIKFKDAYPRNLNS